MRELTTEEQTLVDMNKARGVKYRAAHSSTTPAKYRRLPGHVLVEEFIAPYYPASISDLSARTKIPYQTLQRLIRGNARIDTDMAQKFADFFRNDASYWLDLQSRYDAGESI